MSGDATWGRQIQLDPLLDLEPYGVDWLGSNLSFSLRPMTSLRIDNTYVYSRLTVPRTNEPVLSDHIVRSRWSWQFSGALSLRVILQYESTSAKASQTRVPTRRRFNGDFLLTYRVNPWTALYAGYNGNLQNLQLIETAAGTRLQRLPETSLRLDASQVFVKLSHLLRF